MKAKVKSSEHTMAGKLNPIELPVIDPEEFIRTLIWERDEHTGQYHQQTLAQGDVGIICRVKDSSPPRVYKLINSDKFNNGDEIRTSKLAGELGVSPKVHRVFSVSLSKNSFVVIEMDYAGECIGDYMEKFAEPAIDTEESGEFLDNHSNALLKMLQQLEDDSPFKVVSHKVVRKLSMEETIKRLFDSEKTFYYQLFSLMKKLVENKISFGDLHAGNIMISEGKSRSLQLIDFDGANLMSTVREAVIETMQSAYVYVMLKQYQDVENLSDKSTQLIRWFTSSHSLENTGDAEQNSQTLLRQYQ